MRQTVKEKLNDKTRKMIDLIYDEVCEGGEKNIAAAFTDKRTHLKYELQMSLKVADPDKEEEVAPSDSETQDPVIDPETQDPIEPVTDTDPVEPVTDTDPVNPITDPEGTGETNGV